MKAIDFLSPPITLFHLERRTHTSNIGGILVIIMLCMYIAYITYLLFHLTNPSKITSIFHKKFKFDAGYYSFNTSSIFHFIQIFSPNNGGYFDKFDLKYIRAYTTFIQTDITESNLEFYDHWVFDYCQNNIDNKDLDPSLFQNVDNFTNAVCIKHYYNSAEKKYYFLGQEGFIWPHLEHGMAHKNNIYLTTYIQKCHNNSKINELFGNCPPQEEIDNYVKKYSFIYLYFTDTQIDPTNYKLPIQQYLQTVTTIIGNEKTYIESFIHFSPLKLKTNEGLLFGDSYENNSFCFDYNRRGYAENDKDYFILSKYYHLMQNNVQIYERRYYNIFDLLSEIGGVVQSIFYLFFWVNYIYNRYIIAYDTNSLFFTVKYNIDKKKNSKNVNKLKKSIKKFISLQNINKAKIQLYKKNKIDIIKKENNNLFLGSNFTPNNAYPLSSQKISSINPKKIFNPKNRSYNEDNSSSFVLKESGSVIIKRSNNSKENILLPINKLDEKIRKTYTGFIKKEKIEKFWMTKKSLARIDHKHIEFEKILEKQKIKSFKNITFFDFIKNLLFESKTGNNDFLIKFRKHLLSEEHLFKSHVKTVLLEKHLNYNENDPTNANECFNEL